MGFRMRGLPGCTAGRRMRHPPACRSLAGDRDRVWSDYRAQAQVEPMVTDRLEFFDGGPAIKSAMLEMVRDARDYLLIDSFLLNDDPRARGSAGGDRGEAPPGSACLPDRRLLIALRVGRRRFRFSGSGKGYRSLSSILSIRCGWFVWPRLLERDHRKFWIADGRSLMPGRRESH